MVYSGVRYSSGFMLWRTHASTAQGKAAFVPLTVERIFFQLEYFDGTWSEVGDWSLPKPER